MVNSFCVECYFLPYATFDLLSNKDILVTIWAVGDVIDHFVLPTVHTNGSPIIPGHRYPESFTVSCTPSL